MGALVQVITSTTSNIIVNDTFMYAGTGNSSGAPVRVIVTYMSMCRGSKHSVQWYSRIEPTLYVTNIVLANSPSPSTSSRLQYVTYRVRAIWSDVLNVYNAKPRRVSWKYMSPTYTHCIGSVLAAHVVTRNGIFVPCILPDDGQ